LRFAFKYVMQFFCRFVYSGESCNIEDFDQAQALYKHASLLGLRALENLAKAYIFADIEPANVWKVLQLATDANDNSLEKAAWFVS
jgi:hypothetical protein